MSIKNVIFDFGQVVVHFEPKYMVEQYVKDEEDSRLLQEVVFDRLYWDKLDLGTISDEETLKLVKERVPERLHDACDKIYYNWIYNIPIINGMDELIKELHKNPNVRIFLISNISKYFVSHIDKIPILKEFEYMVFSSDLGVVKPSHIIFDHLCKKCSLIPEECIFIDDNENNIKGAKSFGINGYLFDGDSKKLKAYLEKIL